MADRPLHLRIIDGTPPGGGGTDRQDVVVMRDDQVLGRLPGVTKVDYSLAISGVSKVTLDLIVGDLRIETR